MDIGRSFMYVTEDQEWWKKVLIGGLLSMIPIIGPFYVMGYILEQTANVIAQRETPLPNVLDNFGGRLVKGLMLAVVMFIYFLPLIIIGTCSGASSFIPAIIQDEDVAMPVMIAWSSCFGCLSLIFGIAIGLMMPFVWGIYAETGSFGAALQIGKVFGMLKSQIGPAFLVLLINGLATFLASLVGSILCGIGLIFAAFYAQLIAAFLFGTVYRQAKYATL